MIDYFFDAKEQVEELYKKYENSINFVSAVVSIKDISEQFYEYTSEFFDDKYDDWKGNKY